MNNESTESIEAWISYIRKNMPNIIANAIIESRWDEMKISGWQYDDGKPVYSDTIKQYIGEKRLPSWRCTFRDSTISKWIEEQDFQEDRDFELVYRFNSGDPRYFLAIYNEELATAFALRWVQ